MFRTTTAVLGLVLIAGAAHAGEYKAGEYRVSLVDKTPAQVQAAIALAAKRSCREAYSDDALAIFKLASCEADAVHEANAQIGSAKTAQADQTTLASNR
ncbi:MAG: hypothetical protein JO303_01660 [Caulobacteraceae bacterium]|nr:hypothetical protein [Caulobacteraceae bacterium]